VTLKYPTLGRVNCETARLIGTTLAALGGAYRYHFSGTGWDLSVPL